MPLGIIDTSQTGPVNIPKRMAAQQGRHLGSLALLLSEHEQNPSRSRLAESQPHINRIKPLSGLYTLQPALVYWADTQPSPPNERYNRANERPVIRDDTYPGNPTQPTGPSRPNHTTASTFPTVRPDWNAIPYQIGCKSEPRSVCLLVGVALIRYTEGEIKWSTKDLGMILRNIIWEHDAVSPKPVAAFYALHIFKRIWYHGHRTRELVEQDANARLYQLVPSSSELIQVVDTYYWSLWLATKVLFDEDRLRWLGRGEPSIHTLRRSALNKRIQINVLKDLDYETHVKPAAWLDHLLDLYGISIEHGPTLDLARARVLHEFRLATHMQSHSLF